MFGLVSAIFWLLSAVIPAFSQVNRQNEIIVYGFNAVAAGATAAATISSVPGGLKMVWIAP